MGVSKPVLELLHGPACKPHLPSFLAEGGVLVGLEFGVIVWELVEEDGDGQAVKDDSKRDADEGKHSTQHGLRVHVPVAHSGDAHLQGRKESSQSKQITGEAKNTRHLDRTKMSFKATLC